MSVTDNLLIPWGVPWSQAVFPLFPPTALILFAEKIIISPFHFRFVQREERDV